MPINDMIRDRVVRLIDENGVNLGQMSKDAAQRIADDKGLDLVKVSPDGAQQAVCKLLNYSKFRYMEKKKEEENKKSQSTAQKKSEIKQVQLSQTIDVGDFEVKAKATEKFIITGNKVRVVLRMKGRQQSHPEVSKAVMERFILRLAEVATVEQAPKVEGNSMGMTLVPKKK